MANEPAPGVVLTVVLNGESKIVYDRARPLAQRQRDSLDLMDRKMDEGIDLEGQFVALPDEMQRARFVAAQLVRAVVGDDEPLAAAMTGYLANRLPSLQQVRIQMEEGEVTIDLVFDEPFVKPAVVQFVRRETGGTTRH